MYTSHYQIVGLLSVFMTCMDSLQMFVNGSISCLMKDMTKRVHWSRNFQPWWNASTMQTALFPPKIIRNACGHDITRTWSWWKKMANTIWVRKSITLTWDMHSKHDFNHLHPGDVEIADGISLIKERLTTLTWRLNNDLSEKVFDEEVKKNNRAY